MKNPLQFLKRNCHLLIALLTLNMWGGGHMIEAQIPDSLLLPLQGNEQYFKIFDQFGNNYKYGDIVQKKLGMETCTGSGIVFELDYTNESPQGFGHPTFGQDAKDVICQVLRDISHLIEATPDPCTNLPPEVRLEIREVFPPTAGMPFFYGAAYSYFYNVSAGTPPTSDIVYNNVWRTINGGVHPYVFPTVGAISPGANVYDGKLEINFDPAIGYLYDLNTNPPPVMDDANHANIDFYHVVLHEVMHLLGLASLINANGQTVLSYGDDNYSRYDKYLMETSGTNRLLWNDPTDNDCYHYRFNAPPLSTSILTTPCGIDFTGNQTSADLPIYSPSPYNGSSLSHFDNGCGSDYYIMHPAPVGDATGRPIRVPHPDEAKVLCEIGYKLTGNYGDPADALFHHFQSNAQYQCDCCKAATVDDEGLPCGAAYAKTACDDLVISFADLAANDYNVAAGDIDPNCLEVILGNGSITGITSSNFTFEGGSIGTNVIRYQADNGTTTANTGFIYIEVTPCPQFGCIPDPTSCNLICNGSAFPPCLEGCPSLTSDVENALSSGSSCSNPFPGWANIYGTPGYYPSACLGTNLPPDESALFTFALSNPISTASEGIIGAAETISSNKYVLSFYLRVDVTQINDLTPPIPPTPPPLFLNNFFINLTTQSDVDNAGLPFSGIAAFQTDNTPINFQTVFEAVPTGLQDGDFHQYAVCFESDEDWNRLYFFPELELITTPDVLGLATETFIDRIQLIEDDFEELFGEETDVQMCDECVDLGADLCSEIDNLTYQWEIFNTATSQWDLMPETEPLINVCPTEFTQYRLTRTIAADEGERRL